MKIKEAIFYLKNTPVIASNADKETVQKAYDMAIEALEQPERKKGKWIDSGYGVECSLCGEWYPHASIARNQLNFCPSCGSHNGGDAE